MTSIRKRLLCNLLTLFLLSWLAVAGFTYHQAEHEIEEIFDAQLAQTAGMIAELTLDQIRLREGDATELTKAVYGHKYERKVSFQIWEGDRLLLHSQSAPHDKLSSSLGFSDRLVNGTTWRVFGMQHRLDGYTVYAAEDYEVRDDMVTYIAEGVSIPLLWAVPLLGLLIWLGVGQGLRPLQRVAREVAQKNPQQLRPLESEDVPDEIVPLTRSLNDLLERLHRAFELEKRFTADASHELRTPLAAIRTQTQVALRATDAAERQKALMSVMRGVDRSAHLVEQMLTLARLEPGGLSRRFAPVDMARLAEDVVAELVPPATERRIELSLVEEGGGLPAVDGYRPGLAILLRNLVDNAIRYTPAGGRVELRLCGVGGRCTVCVTDSGPGIPEDERERVFDRFYRQGAHGGYGCGLGLSIVQRIVHLHGAGIELAEGPGGVGLSVSVFFPVSGREEGRQCVMDGIRLR